MTPEMQLAQALIAQADALAAIEEAEGLLVQAMEVSMPVGAWFDHAVVRVRVALAVLNAAKLRAAARRPISDPPCVVGRLKGDGDE
jgi:high-affinity nickel permease